MSAIGSAATEEDSKPEPAPRAANAPALAALLLGFAGAVLLCLTEVSTVIEIQVGSVVAATETGAERHGWALLVLGLAALPLTWLATASRSRPAGVALMAIGAVALLFWGVRDLPAADETGEFGVAYESASAAAGSGLWLELAGGIALLAAGALSAGRSGGSRRSGRRRPDRTN